MKNIQKLLLVAGFALLAACGGNADKFVGEWIDSNPGEEKIIYGRNVNAPLEITIKANGSSEVEITRIISDNEKKNIYVVDGDNILNGGRVIYTLKGDKLVNGSGVTLVRK